MAIERREVIEDYNEKVLEDLMKEMEGMENMAVSKEEALKHAKEETSHGGNKGVFCSKCGLRVTPDVIEHAEMITVLNKGAKEGMQTIKKGDDGFIGLLCNACYAQQVSSSVDEAKVRLGAGEYGYEYGSANNNNYRRGSWSNGDGGGYKRRDKNGSRQWRNRRGDGKEKKRSVQGIDTSSLFDIPKKYDDVSKSTTDGLVPNNEATKSTTAAAQPKMATPIDSSNRRGQSQRSTKNGQRPTSRPPRRTPRMLGGRELAKRMQEGVDSSSDVADNNMAQQQKANEVAASEFSPINLEESSDDDDQFNVIGDKPEISVRDEGSNDVKYAPDNSVGTWVKVEDPGSNQMFYWNTETGEMKKTLD